MMWAWLAMDLVKAALGTDYARVVRAVYILAQVCLVLQQNLWVQHCLKSVNELGGCLCTADDAAARRDGLASAAC